MDSTVGVNAVYAGLSSVMVFILTRIPSEEATLRNQHGEVWDRCAKRVLYKVITWIY